MGTGDYDGDGETGSLWRHTIRGEAGVWLMDGTTRLSETTAATVSDLGYQIVKTRQAVVGCRRRAGGTVVRAQAGSGRGFAPTVWS